MVNTDLHIHSCLSPCADDDMTPKCIVSAAIAGGLELIALTDHNSAKNCPAVAAEARRQGLGFIPGIEVTTSEEIHCICLFPDLGGAVNFSRWLDTLRPGVPNRPASFGRQTVLGAGGRRTEERELLFMARRVTLEELQEKAVAAGALFWPAHVDKPSNSLLSILGCWPQELRADAAELYYEREPAGLPVGVPRLRCSDAHHLREICAPGFPLPLEKPDFKSLRAYLRGEKQHR